MELYKEIEKSFPIIEKLLDDEVLSEFKNALVSELPFYHFGLGVWIRNNLLQPQKILYKLFIENGINNTDDMSCIIIRLFHYHIQKI